MTERVSIIVSLFFLQCIVSGQEKGGINVPSDLRSVQGIVTYAAHEPVRSAVVECEDATTLQIRSYITGSDGKYHFMNLSVDHDYELKAEKQGRRSHVKTLSKFNTQRQATVDLTIEIEPSSTDSLLLR